MDYVSNYTSACDLSVVVLCFILLISLRESFIRSNTNYKAFHGGIIFAAIAAVSNVLYYAACADGTSWYLIMIYRTAYRIGLVAIMQCYIIYVHGMILMRSRTIIPVTLGINIVLCLIDIFAPVLGISRYDNPFSGFLFLNYLFSICVCGVLMHRYSYAIIRQITRTLVITIAVCIFIIMAEFSAGHNSFMTLTFMLPMMVVMIMAHSNPYSIKTGALNRDSFDDFLGSRQSVKTRYMCVKFLAADDFRMPDELGAVFKGFWHGYFKKVIMFNPLPELVVLAIKDNDGADKINSNIDKIMLNLFPSYYERFKIDYKVVVFEDVNFCKSFTEFSRIFNFFGDNIARNTYKICNDADMERLYRNHFIVEQLQDIYNKYDLDDDRVLVYCQPIKNTTTGIYDTAESLMRLQLPQIGFVFPDEFIPIVEKNNLIHRFSMIILNKVCKSITELKDYRINRISVNFSVYELKNREFITDFKKIVTDNNVSYEKIGVEFTESTDIDDFEIIKGMVAGMRRLGCTVYLDDFGTGYSNFDRILGLNMDVVKFDRSLLLLAAEDIKARYVLKSFSDAFMRLQYKILYEGVETDDQEALCVESNADYLQGYKYSKPIPIEDLRKFLQHN